MPLVEVEKGVWVRSERVRGVEIDEDGSGDNVEYTVMIDVEGISNYVITEFGTDKAGAREFAEKIVQVCNT